MDLIWKLTPKKEILDYPELIRKIAGNQDINLREYDVTMVNNVIYSFKDEIITYILEHGISTLINSESLLEYLVPKNASQNNIVEVLHKYLDKVNIDNELIIIDPYFYASSDISYTTLIDLTIEKYLPQIEDLYIITRPDRVNLTQKTTIETNLINKKQSLNIYHKTSDQYHDRFWISNKRESGILTGTSLNGYGKKIFSN